ncbi:uncharacterized protein LOC144129681 [Amblyomma americanum]
MTAATTVAVSLRACSLIAEERTEYSTQQALLAGDHHQSWYHRERSAVISDEDRAYRQRRSRHCGHDTAFGMVHVPSLLFQDVFQDTALRMTASTVQVQSSSSDQSRAHETFSSCLLPYAPSADGSGAEGLS